MLKKLKSFILDDITYIAILLIITAVLSFGLGKLSVLQSGGGVTGSSQAVPIRSIAGPISTSSEETSNKPILPLAISAPAVLQVVSSEAQPQKNYVASKSGTKYHAMNCSGTKTIKETNKIYFSTEDEAQAAGYTRSANCKFVTDAQ